MPTKLNILDAVSEYRKRLANYLLQYCSKFHNAKDKYEKDYTVVVRFSDLDLNTTELHLSLDNFNRDDVTFNIKTKYTDQTSWWN